MASVTTSMDQVFRDFETDGVAASGLHNPTKAAIRSLGPVIDSQIAAAALTGGDPVEAETLIAPLVTAAQEARDAAVTTKNALDAAILGLPAQLSDATAEAVGEAQAKVDLAAGFAEQARNALSGALAASASSAALLAAQHESGLFIDVAGDADTSVIVKDADDAANDSIGDLYSVYPQSTFPQPKMVVDRAGGLEWSAHNNMLQSASFASSPWTNVGVTLTGGQIGTDGRTADATLVAATGTNAYLRQNIVVQPGWYRTDGFELIAGTTNIACIQGDDDGTSYYAYFDLSTGAVLTVSAGITAQISPFDESGNRYQRGYYCSITRKGVAANGSMAIYVRPVDADGSTAVTVGKSIYVGKGRSHRGVKRLAYLATTTAARVGIPYDYSTGECVVWFDVQTTYRGRYSDDFTNAAWVKSNVTAALDATGPHGEPCSTITATADDGYVEQAVTSSGTQQMGFAWVRRKTGTGTLEMSMDGGANYIPITEKVGRKGGTFGEVSLRGFAANPTLRFRIGTNGDEFEIALANVSNRTNVPPPVPSIATDYTMSQNDGRAPLAGLPTASTGTVYIDGIYSPDKTIAESGVTRLGFFGTGSQVCAAEVRMGPLGGVLKSAINDGTGERNYTIEAFLNAGRVQAAAKYEANRHAICVNGEVPFPDTRPGAMTLTSVGITTTERFGLKRLVMVPEAVSENDDSLRTFNLDRDGENVKSFILSTHHFYEYGSRTDADRARIPALAKLWDEGDQCALIAMAGERNINSLQTSPTINEHPQRGVLNRLIYDHSARSFTSDTGGLQPFLENSLHAWATGLGGVQGYTPLLIEHGPYRGRLLHVFVQQDSVAGDKSDEDYRNIYTHYSDNLGEDWSTPVMVIDRKDIILSPGFVSTGENSTIFQIPPGFMNEGRVYVSISMWNTFMGVAWTDDFTDGGDGSGENWTHTAFADGFAVRTTVIPGSTLQEPAVFMLPDGRIGIALRNNNSGGPMSYALSDDYGVTFNAPQAFPGINASNGSNQGVVQTDLQGGRGRVGRLILGRATADGGISHVLQYTTDNDFTLSNPIKMLGYGRFGRYTALEWWPEKGVLFVLVEIQPVTPANTDTGMMLVAVDWAAAVAAV